MSDNMKGKKQKINPKLLIVIVVAAILALGGYGIYNMFFNKTVAVTASNSSAQLDGGKSKYTGETLNIDEDVKEVLAERNEKQRKEASNKGETRVESAPLDKQFIQLDPETKLSPEQLAVAEVPCKTTEYDKDGYNCKTGLDKDGYDKNGFNAYGLDANGCDKNGLDIHGKSCLKPLPKEEPKNQACLDKLAAENCDGDNLKKTVSTEILIPATTIIINNEIEKVVPAGKDNKDYNVTFSPPEKVLYDKKLAAKTNFMKSLIEQNSKHVDPEVFKFPVEEPVEVASNNSNNNNNNNSSTTLPTEALEVQIPVGTTLFTQLMSDLNSDYPGSVKLKVLAGPLRGAILIGSFQVPFLEDTYRPRDKIQISLTTMVFERQSYPVNAIGLDYDSFNDYLSGEVDYHYFTRWGGLIASNLLKGLGQSVVASQSTVSTDGSGVVLTEPITELKDQMKVAAGEVGKELAEKAKNYFDRPPTVSKGRYEQIVVWFNGEVKNPRLPMVFSRDEEVNQYVLDFGTGTQDNLIK